MNFSSKTWGRALALAWGVGVMAAGSAHADTAIKDFYGSALVNSLSASAYSLTGGTASLSFSSALPNSGFGAGRATTTTGYERYNYTYNADGSVASYLQRAYTQVVAQNYFTTDFTLSAHSAAVFSGTFMVGGTVDLCHYRDDACLTGNVASGNTWAGASMAVSGVGMYGMGSQSSNTGASVSFTASSNGGGQWSASGSGEKNGVVLMPNEEFPGTDMLVSAYSFTTLQQGTSFLNLSNTALSGTLELSAYTRSITYGKEILVAVPEPESYAMFLAGLGGLLVAARRRQRQS